MPIAGFQDYWAVGVQAFFKRNAVNSVSFPLIDLGTIESVSPTIEPTTIELFDNKSGRGVRVAKETIRISESYDLTLNNLSPNNRALLMYSNPPENITYTETERNVLHTNQLFIGGTFQVLDSSGNAAVPLNAIAAVFSNGALDTIAGVITAINVSTRTLTMASDQTGTLSPGDVIIIHPDGLADPAKAGTYTISTIAAGSIVLTTALKGNSTNEATVAVDLSHNQTTTATIIGLEGTDWEIYDLELGIIKTASTWSIPSGSLDTPISGRVLYQTAALTGRRLIKPQSATGSIEGEMLLVLSRGANAQRTLRRFNCSLDTGGLNFTADAYSSATITASITSDLTDVDIAGTMLDFKGDIPSFS